MIKKIIFSIFIFIIANIGLVYAEQAEPITVNAIINTTEIKFDPQVIPENTPFIVHVINNAGVPVELENSDTSVEVYAGTDKTFKIGLEAGKYKFFNDFNPKTKTADLVVLTAEEYQNHPTVVNGNTNISNITPNNDSHIDNGSSSILDITFIMWRESIEALLVVGIVFGWLKQLKEGRREGMLFLAGGIALGVLWAMILGYTLIKLSGVLSGNTQEYLQASLTMLAALMIVYMVKWMRSNGAKLKSEMYSALSSNETRRWNISILIVVAVAIAREGSEAVIFIYALGFGSKGVVNADMFGAVAIGLLLAILTIYILSLGNKFFSWKYFFKITEVLLLLLGGAMLLNSVDMLVSVGALPVLKAKFWDTSFILSDGGHFVPLLSSVVGYRATPSLIDILVYLGYWIGVLWFIKNKNTTMVKK
ncbi:MAG: FTR1 family protein [Burkholderiales bacterium]|nr:FTR1 family protein [Burkholderiales bacterium]